MKKNKSRTAYYEETDFSEAMKRHQGRRVIPQIKRVTMNISDKIFQEAHELDGYLSMGYQNVLKTAMTLGLSQLYHQVSSHKFSGTAAGK